MNKAILIQSDDWEGLFVNGKLVEEGHTLNEGKSRNKYFIKLSKQYDFDLEELVETEINEEDEERLYNIGCFPENINELKGKYES